MVETIVTIERGQALRGLVLGAASGIVIGRLGHVGIGLAGPTVLLAAATICSELRVRELSTATLSFFSTLGALVWALS